MALEKTLKSPLDCKEIQPVNPKGNQSWIFIGRIDAEAETPVLWPPDAKNWLIWKTVTLGKIEGRRRGDNRGWNGWMASSTQWTWVWASSRRWLRTGKPGVLHSMGSQRAGHNWATGQQQQSLHRKKVFCVSRVNYCGMLDSRPNTLKRKCLGSSNLKCGTSSTSISKRRFSGPISALPNQNLILTKWWGDPCTH